MKLFDKIKSLFIKKPKVLGLALGSGGAKGMALIGAMKVFEENNLKFDIIAGTSIGSIVGGLYSAGYNTDEMFAFLKEYDITNPKTLIMMKLKGMTVTNLLDNIFGGANIEELKKPFSAIACDLISGEEVVMDTGNVASALASSSAIPPVFRPVTREGRRLIDGAFVNSVPGDVVKKKGADFVVAVSLTEDPMNTSAKRNLDKQYKENGVKECDRYEKGISASDFVIVPDLHNFSPASINELKKMYDIGYKTAKEAMPELLAKLKQAKIIK